MKIRGRFIAAVISAAVVLAPVSFAAKNDGATVGWFLSEVAKARGLSVSSEAEAGVALKGSGVAVPTLDPAKALTEGDVVAIGHALGLTTTTKNPEALFTRTRAQSFLSSFGSEIAGSGDDTNTARDIGGTPNDASNNGKGKKKGHNKSGSEPL